MLVETASPGRVGKGIACALYEHTATTTSSGTETADALLLGTSIEMCIFLSTVY